MAKTLESFEFGASRRPKYPWDQWFDGQIWELSGDDFSVAPITMRTMAHNAALRMGIEARVALRGDKVVIQATGKASE